MKLKIARKKLSKFARKLTNFDFINFLDNAIVSMSKNIYKLRKGDVIENEKSKLSIAQVLI
ncbi:hypothetical protein ACQKOF_11470 [Lysinibacillus sp. NPDC093190]|uniref:hypothetical protein n=1 Tax=Lysinibacillus sp. NPDC093190 TaxID=3390575 RepID=UPI003D004E42